jgi:hypothetical protein
MIVINYWAPPIEIENDGNTPKKIDSDFRYFPRELAKLGVYHGLLYPIFRHILWHSIFPKAKLATDLLCFVVWFDWNASLLQTMTTAMILLLVVSLQMCDFISLTYSTCYIILQCQ